MIKKPKGFLFVSQTKPTFILYCDGASRGNPGESGAGAFVVHGDGKEEGLRRYLGPMTNNQAEYQALLLGLEHLRSLKAKVIEVRADSELMIRQLNGQYRVKNKGLIPLFAQAKHLLAQFTHVTLRHVPREENKRADRLANEAIDRR